MRIKGKSLFLFSLVFLFLINPSFVLSQSLGKARIKIYNQDNGIAQNFGQAVLADKDNFIWLGTQAGLNKFNGYGFELYVNERNNKNSLYSNQINVLHEDKEKNVWIGTVGGLCKLNKIKNRVSRVNLGNSEEESAIGIKVISENEAEDILVGGFNGALFLGNISGNKFSKIKSEIKEGIFSIVYDKSGNAWIGTDGNGLYVLKKGSIIPVPIKINENNNLISKIVCLCFNKNNELLIGTRKNGVFKLRKNGENEYSLDFENSTKDLALKCIFKDRKNTIWLGTDGQGLYYKNQSESNFSVFEESVFTVKNNLFNVVSSITEDLQGNIWLGCYGGGLVQINFNLYPFNLLFKSSTDYEIVDNTSVIALHINKDKEYWISFKGGRVKTNEKINLDLIKKIHDKNADIFSILTNLEEVYFGTNLGLFKGNKKSGELIKIPLPKEFVHIIKEFDNKIVFIHYGGGLSYLDKRTNILNTSLNNNFLKKLNSVSINCFDTLKSNGYALGTFNGIVLIDKKFELKREIKTPEISGQFVTTISGDNFGNLWCGYDGQGIDIIYNCSSLFNNKNSAIDIFNFNKNVGLTNETVMGIIVENNYNLWASTIKGIFNIKLKKDFYQPQKIKKSNEIDKNKFTIKTYLSADGLPCNEFNLGTIFKTKDNTLYFGGINGVVYFNPKNLVLNLNKPYISFTSFKVFGVDLRIDSNITFKKNIDLNYKQNIFSIEFVALDYSSPEKNQYAYQLEGFDKDWIYSGQRRFANYTNLDPGDYIFKVKASNNDGVWNDKGIELKISISPPFYKTKWFYSLSTLLFFSLIYAFIKRREIQLKKENKVLESKVTERTKEIENINSILYKKNRDITDSINYAKRIQEAFLLPEFELKKLFKDAFIFFNPKDIVSGDFYWFTKENSSNDKDGIEKIHLIAAADCTGHGVPGALMSMIGIDRLSECSKKTNHPGKILKLLNQSIKDSLRQSVEYSESEVLDFETTRDGMDICLCQIAYFKDGQIRIRYSGANRPLWMITNSQREIKEIKQNKSAIGGFTAFDYFFEEQELFLEKGDKIYMFTDGYCDQFGGPDGKKFLTKRFRTFLSSISHLPMFQQSQLLEQELEQWMGSEEQVDDLLVIGFTV